MNLRYVRETEVPNTLVANPGDDGFGIWDDQKTESALSLKNVETIYSGVRGKGGGQEFYAYGRCVGIYGIGQLTIEGLTCQDRICPNDQSIPANTKYISEP
ncbi:hypothetical protein MK280_00300 [Myxococcota bacterium]|nr:hypothetical protein [Myxococcota bacterium]